MPFGLISNLINAGTNIANAVIGSNQFYDNKRHELFINDLNWERTKLLNKWNREYELEDRNYLAEREDTAVQRRAKDLADAGINPLLAVGGGGAAASGIISNRNTSNYSPATHTPSYSPPIGNFPEIGNPIERLLEKERKIAEIEKIKAETKATGKNTEGTELDNIRKETENEYIKEKLKLEIQEKILTNKNIEQTGRDLIQEYGFRLNQEERERAMHEINKLNTQVERTLKAAQTQNAMANTQSTDEERIRAREEFEIYKNQILTDQAGKIAEIIGRAIGAGIKTGGKK